jgi:hypothetical protein
MAKAAAPARMASAGAGLATQMERMALGDKSKSANAPAPAGATKDAKGKSIEQQFVKLSQGELSDRGFTCTHVLGGW